jgi:hypothetical protein
MFPSCASYFTVKRGIENKHLDVYKGAIETAHATHDCVITLIKENRLCLDNVLQIVLM